MTSKEFADALRVAARSAGSKVAGSVDFEAVAQAPSLRHAMALAVASNIPLQTIEQVAIDADSHDVYLSLVSAEGAEFIREVAGGVDEFERDRVRESLNAASANPIIGPDGQVAGYAAGSAGDAAVGDSRVAGSGQAPVAAQEDPSSGSAARQSGAAAIIGDVPVGDENETKFLGVPDDFVAQTEGRLIPQGDDVVSLSGPRQGSAPIPTGGAVPPVYEHSHADEPDGWQAGRIFELQKSLIDAGLLKATDIIAGMWDKKSRDAYAVLLSYANRTGTHNGDPAGIPTKALAQLKQNGGLDEDADDEVFERRVWREPDADELSQSVKQFMRQRLGRDPRDHELATLSSKWATEQRRQFEGEEALRKDQFDAQTSEQPTPVGGTPDAVSSFGEWFDSKYQPEFDRNTAVVNTTQRRQSMLGSMTAMDRMIGGR